MHLLIVIIYCMKVTCAVYLPCHILYFLYVLPRLFYTSVWNQKRKERTKDQQVIFWHFYSLYHLFFFLLTPVIFLVMHLTNNLHNNKSKTLRLFKPTFTIFFFSEITHTVLKAPYSKMDKETSMPKPPQDYPFSLNGNLFSKCLQTNKWFFGSNYRKETIL